MDHPTPAGSHTGPRWLNPPGPLAAALALLVGGILAYRSFGASANWFIDFGREVYVPWRLTEGDALLRDIAYFNGPLSPYVNALWFGLFGVSMRAQAILNLLILAITSVVIWHLMKRLAGRLAALVATVGWLPLLAFQHLGHIGNFNWIAPYSHEMPHGIALGLGAMLCVGRYLDRPGPLRFGLCGLLTGLCALTKPEITLATGVGVGTGFLTAWWRGLGSERTRKDWLRDLAGGAIGFAIPILCSVLLLTSTLGLADAIQATLGGWRYVFLSELRALKFYRTTMGTEDLGQSLVGIAQWILVWGYSLALPWTLAFLVGSRPELPRRGLAWVTITLCVAPIALHSTLVAHGLGLTLYEASTPLLVGFGGLALFASRSPGPTSLRASVVYSVVAPLLLLIGQATLGQGPLGEQFGLGVNWEFAFRPLTVVCVGATAGWAWAVWRDRQPNAKSWTRASVFRLGFGAFATAMLLKILLRASTQHYGFGLAVPAVLVSIAALVEWLPNRLGRSASRPILLAGGVGMVLFAAAGVGIASHQIRSQRTAEVAGIHAGDAMWQRELVGDQVALLDQLIGKLGPKETLAVVPEGITFNYRFRRINPTGHLNLMPPELIMFGEENIVADFAEKAPDAILLIHRVTAEYGVPLFSKDYGVKLAHWIQANYTTVAQLGTVPFVTVEDGGALLLRRNDLLPKAEAKKPK